jgi:hypothetical protein
METSLLQEYYCVDGHAVDHFVAAINCHFACNPLLNCNHQSMFEFGRAWKKALSRENM